MSINAHVDPIDIAELTSWPTRRLLGLRDRLLRCEESLELSDVQDPSEVDPATIRFKEDPRWYELYEAVKDVLSGREHVPRPSSVERKAQRRERARLAKTRGRSRKPKQQRS